MKSLGFRNDKALDFFEDRFKEDADVVLLEGALFDLVRRGVISGGKAAELLGVSRWNLPDMLARHDVDTIDYSKDELDREAEAFRNALGEAQ